MDATQGYAKVPPDYFSEYQNKRIIVTFIDVRLGYRDEVATDNSAIKCKSSNRTERKTESIDMMFNQSSSANVHRIGREDRLSELTFISGLPVEVGVTMYVLSISSLSEVQMVLFRSYAVIPAQSIL